MLLQTLAVQDRPLSGKSRQPRNYRLAVSWTSSPRNFDIVTDTGPAVPAPRPHGRRDPWLRSGSEDGMTLPLAGRPGHGRTAFVRLQPTRIVDGRYEGGYTGLFELICPGCGDHPYLDYQEIPPRLRWLRGPRSLKAALAVYHKHLGSPGTNGDSAGSLGPGTRLAWSPPFPDCQARRRRAVVNCRSWHAVAAHERAQDLMAAVRRSGPGHEADNPPRR
jgi:hypothetical protein